MSGLLQPGDKQGYYLPASLINKLIVSIIIAIFTVGGYMILWAINDAAWKSAQEARFNVMTMHLNAIDKKLVALPPPWLVESVDRNRQDIKELREKVNDK